jgi:ketosteroid isomerase-like protein
MEQLPNALRRFLDGVATGDWNGMERHFTRDAIQDGSMPGWRVQYQGPERIVQALREDWTAKGGWHFQRPRIMQAGDAVALELEAAHASGGERVVCRTANIFDLRDGRIAEHRYYCCGEWDEATLRRIDVEAPKSERPQALT